MLDQTDKVSRSASDILGDLAALAEQLGGGEGLFQWPSGTLSLASQKVQSSRTLAAFLKQYVSGVLIRHELPAVAQAYTHATRYEVRELISLDRSLNQEVALSPFAEASRRIGRMQLLRLRPLRGERLLQRYLKSVEDGEACGWHSVVFGVVLALYSFPLRQGLAHFSQQTVSGFIEAASNSLSISHAERHQLLAEHAPAILQAIESLLGECAVKP